MTNNFVAADLLLALLDGARFANALRHNGKPCRIRLPGDPQSRDGLISAHLRGASQTLTFCANGYDPWRERVDAVVLAALCPAVDGRCRWVGIDLDADDHGSSGLVDPVHAVRALAERADAAGLGAGLFGARSRRGRGRHVFILLPDPVALRDAVIGVAALVAASFNVAGADVKEYDAHHAFRCANGVIARPGDAGSVEMLPRSTAKPLYGWAMILPHAGAFAAHGGGVLVDPFDDKPTPLQRIPRCDHEAWILFIQEARVTLSEPKPKAARRRTRQSAGVSGNLPDRIARIDSRTRSFLDGRVTEGHRNTSAFAASANLLGCGIEERTAERLILAGAATCGLPEREARCAFASALNALARNGSCKR